MVSIVGLQNFYQGYVGDNLAQISKFLPGGSEGEASACNAGDLGSISGSGGSAGEGNGNQPQYSDLEATVHGMVNSRTQLHSFMSHESDCLPLLAAKLSDSTFHVYLIRVKQAWPSTFTEHSPLIPLLSTCQSVCTLGGSLHNSKCAGNLLS